MESQRLGVDVPKPYYPIHHYRLISSVYENQKDYTAGYAR
jgi:hypothetical protein